jgi:hypothetical protein
MAINLPFIGGSKSKQKKLAELTPRGMAFVDSSNAIGPKASIMWYLKSHGASTIKEVSAGTGMPFQKTKFWLDDLHRDRKIQWI